MSKEDMKTSKPMRTIPNEFIGSVLVWALATTTFAQTDLQFTGVKTTPENAIQLFWASNTNEVYEIDYADQLAGNPDGTTAWNTLYDDYPSQGTNTFIGDFGNYFLAPPTLHPSKTPMRFYRVVDKGMNSGASPSVTITSITNGATLSDQITVTVAVTSSLPIVTTALYIDGQLMDSSDDGSNYVINTCEWRNGPHVLFATAKVQSALSGPSGSWPISIGRGVSPYVSVNFTNLITGIAFSQPFFEPSLGQTQQVTATFAANVDWTLQIIDESSNAVRTVTGNGTSLQFNWDGAGDGGTNIPDGVYYYLISAQTNGQAYRSSSDGGDSDGSGSLLSLSFASMTSGVSADSMELWAMPADGSGAAVPFMLYPPGFDTNSLIIFQASSSQMEAVNRLVSGAESDDAINSGSGAPADDASPAYDGASSQSTTAPSRPPTAPIKNAIGAVGVAYFDFKTSKTYAVPLNGMPLPGNSGKVQIEGSYGGVLFTNIPQAAGCADKFVARMRNKGWWGANSFNLSGSTIRLNYLRSASLGGSEIFGNVNIGLFIDHGSYGTSPDYNSYANWAYETYLPSDNPVDASAPWLSLSEFGLAVC